MYRAFIGRSEKIEIKGFLGYLCSGKPSDYLTEDIDQRVERLKINEIFRSDYMMDALPLHDARKAGLKDGMALGEAKGEKKRTFGWRAK